MSKAEAINSYEKMVAAMQEAHDTSMAQFIELVKVGKAKGERLGSLTHVVGSSISHLGEEIAREKYALALLEVDANMNYDLDAEEGINELSIYIEEKMEACAKYTAHWAKVYARWSEHFGINN